MRPDTADVRSAFLRSEAGEHHKPFHTFVYGIVDEVNHAARWVLCLWSDEVDCFDWCIVTVGGGGCGGLGPGVAVCRRVEEIELHVVVCEGVGWGAAGGEEEGGVDVAGSRGGGGWGGGSE